jgi:glucokinase
MKKASIGVDIGGTNTRYGIVDETGNVLLKGSIPTPTKDNVKKYIDDISKGIKILMQQINDFEYIGIGIGAPNGNYYTGNIELAPNLPFKGVVPIVALLKEQFPAIDNIVLTNDANAAALGEMKFGGAKGMRNFVMITLGTGLGGGVVVNGEMVYGKDSFAGELGHILVTPEGRECGCGQFGHLETYCSATGMVRTAFDLLSHHNAKESVLANKTFNELTSKEIYEAACQGDEIALTVFEITGDILGQALADIVHILSPEAIFFFGGPVAAGELLFKPTRESMENHLMPIFKNKTKILLSQLRHGDAAIVGASALTNGKN